MELIQITWIQCDACEKWRQVPQSLVDGLDDDAEWNCSMSPDPLHNTCDAPQELSDQDIDKSINKEVTLVNGHGASSEKSLRPAIWQHVTENIYTHRGRKVEHEDEIMVCHCKPPRDGSMGCGEQCLNRRLYQECNPEYCPCGDQCSNTQFARKRYANIESRRAGAKGFGLFTNQDLKEGNFIIEYVGEVLEEEEYMRRKVFYAASGQRHYYFMNIGNGEIVDACRKGALGRFINHSCEPNCETQKWLVHGELTIGLFALKDIKADTELTFDYNFERYGDKAMNCLCGSKKCRGFIGGSQEQAEAEDAADASNDPEPIMIEEGDLADNPACEAILAEEIGLAVGDFRDEDLRRGYEQLAAKYGVSLEWQGLGGQAEDMDDSPAESAKESKTQNGPVVEHAALEAVEQKLKIAQQAAQRAQKIASSKSAATIERKHVANRANSSTSMHSPARPLSVDTHMQSALNAAVRPNKGASSKGFRRRSEVDRRLECMVAPSGKLKEINMQSVIRMLRLFNLCDLGTASTESPKNTYVKAANSEASSMSVGATYSGANGALSHSANNSDASREEAHELIEHHSKRQKTHGGDFSPRSSSPVKKARMEIEVTQNENDIRAVVTSSRSSVNAGQLSSRQRARMADLSLLLDVILKTSSTSNLKVFCQSGILRQLQSVIARCHGSAFSVIIKKMMRAVEHLPLSANDYHQHTSAHGSFADTLWLLGKHSDHEVRNKARALREKFPLNACSEEVQESARAQANRPHRPHYRTEGRGDLGAGRGDFGRIDHSGTPNSRLGTDRGLPGRGLRGRWHSDLSHGPPHSSDRFGRGRSRMDLSPWPQQHRMSHPPSSRLSHGSHMDRKESESWRRMHQANSTPFPQDTPDWHLNIHPAHKHDHGGHATPHSMSHQRTGNRPHHNMTPLYEAHGQSGHLMTPLSIPDTPAFTGLDNLSASNPPPPPAQEQIMSVGNESPRPPLPSEPPPPLPPSPAERPDSIQDPPPPAPDSSPPPPPNSSYWAVLSESEPQANHSSNMSLGGIKAANSTVRRPSRWSAAHADGALDKAKLKAAMSAPLPVPATVLEVKPNGTAQELPFVSGPADSLNQGSNPSGVVPKEGSANPVQVSSVPEHGASQMPSIAHSGPKSNVGQIQDVPTPQLPIPPQSTAEPSQGGSPTADGKTWNQPDRQFEEFVEAIIRHRLKKNQQPGHPNPITAEESKVLYQKSRRAIIDAEREAYSERKRAQAFKAIERSKVELRIKEYVRDLIHRLHDRKHARTKLN